MSKRKQQHRERGHTDELFRGSSAQEASDYHFGDHDDALVVAARKRPKVRPVQLDNIVIDQRIQVRVGGEDGLDQKHVDTLVQVLINGGTFQDDIVLFYEDEDLVEGVPEPLPPFILADGFHRLEAYKKAAVIAQQMLDAGELPPGVNVSALKAPRASLRYGDFDTAYEYAEEANLRHGQMLSNKDKKNILGRRMKRGHAWTNASANSVAAELGVTDKTVARWRDDILKALGMTSEFSEVVIGADGRPINTSAIGARSKLTPEQRAAKTVAANLRKAAKAMGPLQYDEVDADKADWLSMADWFEEHWGVQQADSMNENQES